MSFQNKNEFELDKKNAVKLSKFTSNNSNELLLLEAGSEDLSILHTIGLDNSIKSTLNEKNKIDALNSLKNVYGKSVYLGSDIKDLCIKYDLRLLRADKYNGKIDVSLAKIIKDFSENEKQHVNLGINSFFVLAPSENFGDDAIKNSKLCTVFYRETNNSNIAESSDKFIKIHSWGENYSELRQLNFMLSMGCSYDNEDSYIFGTYGCIAGSLVIFIMCWIFDIALLNLIFQTILWGSRWLFKGVNSLQYFKRWDGDRYN
jgi:hypothetical protein